MAQLSANGLQIEYDTFGKADAEPLLLIIGLGTQMTAWSPDFCNALAAKGHYVVRFDNRDVGLSTKFHGVRPPSRFQYFMNHVFRTGLTTPYSLADMASDAAGILDALDIASAHIVGASMGGMIAQLLTVNYPERVRSLTSWMSTSGDPNLPTASRAVLKQLITGRPDTSDPEVMLEYSIRSAQLISSPAYPRSDDDWRDLISAFLARSFYPEGFARQIAAIIADGSRVQRLKTIARPTLVIHGREDPLVPVECGIDTAKHIEGARLEIIDGMGHDIPSQLVDTLTSLIAEHTRGSTRRNTNQS